MSSLIMASATSTLTRRTRLPALSPILQRATFEFTHYSDGRVIRATEMVDNHVHISHIFAAVPEHRGERLLFTDRRPHDPGTPDRGHYRVYVDDAAARLRVEVFGPLEAM